MTVETAGQVWLNRQADRIERTLSSLDLPVRISGGQVRENGVRYHLTPMGATQTEALESAQSLVADALGVERVRVAREVGGLAIDVTGEAQDDLRLLPLMHAVGTLPPLTAVIGMAAAGHPLTLSLRDQTSQHLLVEGAAGSGKSELLRTLLLSMALTSRPSQLQVMGLEADGRQLVCLEALPHALTDLASEAEFALDLLDWLEQETRRRASYAVEQPRLLLLVDGYDRLQISVQRALKSAFSAAIEAGPQAGVHFFITGRRLGLMGNGQSIARASAGDRPGVFEFQAGDSQIESQVSWMPAQELAKAIQLARQSPGSLDRGQLTAVLGSGY